MGLNAGNLVSGALNSVPVVGGALSSVASVVSGLFGGGGEPDGRYAHNAAAYQWAMSGHRDGAIDLKGRGGLGDGKLSAPIPGVTGGGLTAIPWPADGPRQDAAKKYGQLVAAAAQGNGGAAAALGPETGPTTPAGQAAQAAGQALTQPLVAGIPTWAVLLGAGGLGFLLLKRR